MIRDAWHRAWRLAARHPRLRQELPGFGFLHAFCWGYVQIEPPDRPTYLEAALKDAESPYLRAFRRAGGAHAGLALVFAAAPPPMDYFDAPLGAESAVRVVAGNLVTLSSILYGQGSIADRIY